MVSFPYDSHIFRDSGENPTENFIPSLFFVLGSFCFFCSIAVSGSLDRW